MAEYMPNKAIALHLLKSGGEFQGCLAPQIPFSIKMNTPGFGLVKETSFKDIVKKSLEAYAELRASDSRTRINKLEIIEKIAKLSRAKTVQLNLASKTDGKGRVSVFCSVELSYERPLVEYVTTQGENLLLLADGNFIAEEYTLDVSKIKDDAEKSAPQETPTSSSLTRLEVQGFIEDDAPKSTRIFAKLDTSEVLQNELRRAVDVIPQLQIQREKYKGSRFFWVLGRGLAAEIGTDTVVLGYSDLEARMLRFEKLTSNRLPEETEPHMRRQRRLELDYTSKAFIKTFSKNIEEETNRL
jgi:hypothetical protein